MPSPSWQLTDRDRAFFVRELEDFLPDSIFDAHVHLGYRSDYSPKHAELCATSPEVADMSTYRREISWLIGGRELLGAMVMPTTLAGERLQEGNAFAAKQAATDEYSGSSVIVDPRMTADQLRAEIDKHSPVSLKPYYLMSPFRPVDQSTMEQYLPEHTVAVAHEAGLPIIMHMVLPAALADERNQRTIRHYCERYPRMTMVLAHCARGFNPSHTVRGIGAIADLDNVMFDTSCVCESGGMEAILTTFGHTRLMWGSDYPFSHHHGRCVAIDDGFTWLYQHNFDPGPLSLDPQQEFTLVGLESLRALKFACLACRLDPMQLEAIFRDNAMQLFQR